MEVMVLEEDPYLEVMLRLGWDGRKLCALS